MKIVGFACLLVFFNLSVALAEDAVLTIIDKSASGSPLENIGTATLSETIKEGTSRRSNKIEWTVRNKSPKAIVTIIETLRIRYASGHIIEGKNQYEAFFGPKLVKAGGTISFPRIPREQSFRAALQVQMSQVAKSLRVGFNLRTAAHGETSAMPMNCSGTVLRSGTA